MYYNNFTLSTFKIRKILKAIFLFLFFPLFFLSCKNLDFFEKTVPLPQQKWGYDYHPTFTIAITDTVARYNIYIVIRHTDAYKYNNLWIRSDIKFPGDSLRTQNIDISLATDAKGWAGKGIDDIFEYRKNVTPGPIALKRSGTYTFTLSQIMRENPIEHILNIGVRVEKVKF